MTSPSSAHRSSCGDLPKKVLRALLACAFALLASCQYPSSYSPGYSYPAQAQAPAYGYSQPTGYARPYTVTNNPITNNPVTNRAAAWAKRVPMQSANPAYPTANSNPNARGRRRVPDAQAVANRGVFGGTQARQPVYNTQPQVPQQQYTQPVAMRQPTPAPVGWSPPAQTQAQIPTPTPANSWQAAPHYPTAPAGYGPVPQTQGAGYTNVNYTGTPTTYPAPGVGGSSTYTIQKGDSLSVIAQRLQVPLGSLMQVNGLTAHSVIHPNTVLTVPGR